MTIDISKLKVGDTVRNIGSGNAYKVSAAGGGGRVFASKEVEISNLDEWELVASAIDHGRIESFIHQHDMDRNCYELIRQALKNMRACKPEGRGEKARRYAVSITEMERVLAYFHMYVVNDGAGE